MLGLEHRGHAALADLFQHHVVAQQQLAGFACQQHGRLVVGEPVLADEFAGQSAGIAREFLAGQVAAHGVDLLMRHQAESAQRLHKVLDAGRHGAESLPIQSAVKQQPGWSSDLLAPHDRTPVR